MIGGALKRLRGWIVPRHKAGFAFKLRTEVPVAEIYGEKQQAGSDIMIVVRGDNLEVAKLRAVREAKHLEPGASVEIVAMKDAFADEMPSEDEVVVLNKQDFGQSKHGRF